MTDSARALPPADSLAEFLSTASPRRIPAYDPHPCPSVNVRQCVVAINDSTLTSSDTTVYYSLLEDRSKVRVKLFKFHSDVRPGYVGTWTKTSHVVGPRTPFARETALLNYAVDSDDEWEEEVDDPDAEDVGSDGGARSDEEGGAAGTGAESEADSWLADDDEIEYEAGYDADGDIAMLDAEGRGIGGDDDDIIVVEGDKERRRRERDAKKKKVERERKKKEREAKRGPMLPVAKGLCWQHDVGAVEDTVFEPMRIQFLNGASLLPLLARLLERAELTSLSPLQTLRAASTRSPGCRSPSRRLRQRPARSRRRPPPPPRARPQPPPRRPSPTRARPPPPRRATAPSTRSRPSARRPRCRSPPSTSRALCATCTARPSRALSSSSSSSTR